MADKVNLQKSFSMVNEKLATLFDESGIRRSFTVPYIDGQPTTDHIAAVGMAASQSGGLTNNLLTSAHHSGGKGWGTGDGHTVAHPSDKLRVTVIPKDDEHAKAAIDAAQSHLNNIEKLIGDDDPSVQTAKSQLGLVKKTDGAGMNLLDFGVLVSQILYAPNQAVARAHSGTKDGGHAPQLRAPGAQTPDDQGSQPEAGGDDQTNQAAPEGQGDDSGAAAAPDQQQQAPAEAAAAPAQG